MATNNANIQGANAPQFVNAPGAQGGIGGPVAQPAHAPAANIHVAPAIDQEFETEWEEAHRE
ncbi:hypothetical protein FRC14_000245, partial [Serendipita sp. 396]